MDKYKILIIIFAIILINQAHAGCWTKDGEVCSTECYTQILNQPYFSNNQPSICHDVEIQYLKINYYSFSGESNCRWGDNDTYLQNCRYGINPLTAYNQLGAATSCTGQCVYNKDGSFTRPSNDNCGLLSQWGKGCSQAKFCNRFLGIFNCQNNANQGCHTQYTISDCRHGKHEQIGCSWVFKQRFNLEPKIVYETLGDCVWNATACPSTHKLNPNNNVCVVPFCDDVINNARCNDTFGDGFFCNNSGQWNAECAPIPGHNFGFTVFKELDNENYSFYIRADYTGFPWLDLYKDSNLLYYGLNNDQKFIINDKSYSSLFQIPNAKTGIEARAFSLQSSSTFNRLTYGIFPVCGNGVCETCESEDNCISYPPESCLSCPADCPQNSFADLMIYNTQYKNPDSQGLSFADILTNPDDACKVRTRDYNSECNPLCVSHEFIDSSGCIFNKYSNALPEDEFESRGLIPLNQGIINCSSGPNCYLFEDLNEPIIWDEGPCSRCAPRKECRIILGDDVNRTNCGLYEKSINFNNKEYSVFFSGNNKNFYGTNNSLCSHDCECVSGNCAGNNFNDKHCCDAELIWNYDDSKNNYCHNGRIKPEYREELENYDGAGIINSTKKVSVIEGSTISTGGIDANQYICLDNPLVTLSGVSNYTSCFEGYDPFCVYGEPNTGNIKDYSVIKPNGIGQCREEREETIKVFLEELTCVVHSHALARAGCRERNALGGCKDGFYGFSPNPHYNFFCVTDNPDECSSAESLWEFLGGIKPVLRTITYKEFCTTQQLVCSGTERFTNDHLGGTLPLINCPQDSMAASGWFQGASITKAHYPEMTVGYYCSLFGNDYSQIMSINAGNNFDVNDGTGMIEIDMSKYAMRLESGAWAAAVIIPLSVEVGIPEGPFQNYTLNPNLNIINIRTPHMPMVDRNANERLYNYLWNYESCVENFGLQKDGGLVPSCRNPDNNNRQIPRHPRVYLDNLGYPNWGAVMGKYDMTRSFSEYNHNDYSHTLTGVRSREFCEKLWVEYKKIYPLGFDFKYPSFPDSLTVGDETINSEEKLKKIILSSCIQWEPGFRDAYYSNLPAKCADEMSDNCLFFSNIFDDWEIHPPTFDWYWKIATVIPAPLIVIDSITPFDDYFRRQSYCSSSTGLNSGSDGCIDYPYGLHGGDSGCLR